MSQIQIQILEDWTTFEVLPEVLGNKGIYFARTRE